MDEKIEALEAEVAELRRAIEMLRREVVVLRNSNLPIGPIARPVKVIYSAPTPAIIPQRHIVDL